MFSMIKTRLNGQNSKSVHQSFPQETVLFNDAAVPDIFLSNLVDVVSGLVIVPEILHEAVPIHSNYFHTRGSAK